MAMLADRVDGVIGIDTHRDTLTATAVSAVGGLLGQLVVAADAAGYRRLLDFARVQIPGAAALRLRVRAAMVPG